MKKNFFILSSILLVLVACTPTTKHNFTNIENTNQELIHNYYSKDVSDSFRAFLSNPDENTVLSTTTRATKIEPDNKVGLTENDMFAEIWQSLSSDEKQMLRDDPSKISVWKKQGVDIDADTFAWNLISPENIYASHIDKYATFTIKFLWWSKTWKWKIYNATTNLLTEEHR